MKARQATPAPARLPLRPPFYYGWVVVAALGTFSSLNVAMAGPNIAFFIEPINQELGWSRSVFGWSQFAKLLPVIISGAFLGRMMDRHGPRVLLTVVGVVAGTAVVAMAFMQAPWQFVLLSTAMGLLGLGRAADLYVYVPISKWFVRRRGRANSMAFLGTTAGILVFMPVTQWLIEAVGWRQALLIFGVGGAAVIVPMALLLLRRQPEDLGLLPDGAPAPSPAQDGPRAPPLEVSWTRREAMGTGAFWFMVAGFSVYAFSSSTMNIFRVPHFVERGLDPALVAWAISLDAAVAAVVAMVVGPLLDRFPPRFVVLAGFAAMLACALVSVVTDSVVELFLATSLFGVGAAVTVVSQGVMWANTFGRVHLGAIRGLTVPMTMAVSALAYPLTGTIRDLTGAYAPAWWVAAGCLLVGAALLALARPPRKGGAQEA